MYSVLIDAAQGEDFRVVTLDKDGYVIKFDYEFSSKKKLKGNLYVSCVSRVDSALQAAFVEYGGNRAGFLPFSEIHPCYYQISSTEKSSLLSSNSDSQSIHESDTDELTGSAIFSSYKKYKIQDVIKEGQLILLQVMKEERGTKGVYMSSYIGLSGRLSVLLPNTPGKRCISKKISDSSVRDNLNKLLAKMSSPKESSVILRSEAAVATKEGIVNDLNYLAFLWNNIKQSASKAKSFGMIYDSGDILKRTVRDLSLDKLSEIVVNDVNVMRDVESFLKTIVSEDVVKELKIRLYKGVEPIFSFYKVENQLADLFSHTVQLRNAGYLVISRAEALTAIDVNSGSTMSHSDVEKMALSINKDAVVEIARHVQLRNISGLIVIDFIDMGIHKNRRIIETMLRKAFVNDSARVQFGEISQFGLLEMSRQRIAQDVLEDYTVECSHCKGRGYIANPVALSAEFFRVLFTELRKSQSGSVIKICTSRDVAVYLLNSKRDTITDIENKFKITIEILINQVADDFSTEVVSQNNLTFTKSKEYNGKSKAKNTSDTNKGEVLNNAHITKGKDVEWVKIFLEIIM